MYIFIYNQIVMKRIHIIFILFLSCAYSVCAQQLHEIHFKGEEIISISGDRLLPVEGKESTWKINIKNNTVENFKLVSENTAKVDYVFSGDYVVFFNTTGMHRSSQIPYLMDQKSFYGSAVLEIKRELLPITIKCNGKVIATFELPSVPKNYQNIEPFKKDTIYVGGNICLTYTEGKNLVKAKQTTLHLKAKNHSYSFEGEEIIAKDVEPGEYKVVVDLTFEDGNSQKSIDCGSICVLEEINPLISFLKEHLFLSIIACLVVLIALIAFVLRKMIPHVIKYIKLRLGKRDIADSTQDDEGGNDIASYNIDHTHDDQQHNQEKPIEDVLKEKESLIEDLYKQIGKLQLQLDNVGQTLITPVNDGDLSSLKETVRTLQTDAQKYLDKIDEQTGTIHSLEQRITELTDENGSLRTDNVSKKDLRQKIQSLTEEKGKLVRERQRFEKDLIAARRDKELLEKKISEKDEAIDEANREKETWKTKFSIESNKSSQLQVRLNSFSKQTHYVYAIDDALCMVDNSLKTLFATVNDSNLMKRLAQPILSGTAGLDSGLETYLSDWRNLVYDNQERFFGDQVLNLKNDDVKNKLITDYLEPLALRDSFGKLVRLYLMTNVGWINEQMVKAGFDVDAIQTLFAQFKNLFTYFGVELSYPHLFIDKFDSNLHKDNMRCEIFNYFEPSEDLRSRLSSRECENLIVDVTRIGIPSSKTSARKMAMVSLPNF